MFLINLRSHCELHNCILSWYITMLSLPSSDLNRQMLKSLLLDHYFSDYFVYVWQLLTLIDGMCGFSYFKTYLHCQYKILTKIYAPFDGNECFDVISIKMCIHFWKESLCKISSSTSQRLSLNFRSVPIHV